MKISTEPTFREWRKWFAWRPVKTENVEWIWLEWCEFKKTQSRIPNVFPSGWTIYRRISKQEKEVGCEACEAQCPHCGYYCLGKGGIFCIHKPSLPHTCTRKSKKL